MARTVARKLRTLRFMPMCDLCTTMERGNIVPASWAMFPLNLCDACHDLVEAEVAKRLGIAS